VDQYDPLVPPDPEEWLALDEAERLQLVLVHLRGSDEELPNKRLHAAFHVIIENQIAMGDETPAQATLERLMNDGLDRHDAIHAIGSVLSDHVYHLMTANAEADTSHQAYFQGLRSLTVKSWRDRFR
jgi:hypothetical protein